MLREGGNTSLTYPAVYASGSSNNSLLYSLSLYVARVQNRSFQKKEKYFTTGPAVVIKCLDEIKLPVSLHTLANAISSLIFGHFVCLI